MVRKLSQKYTLILLSDNVSINGKDDSSVYGTPRFMAPEIVVGKAKPSRNTDLFSLAVLLFYIFMLNHPLEGKLEANIKCMDIFAMNQLFGTNPVFIFDPDDKSNRPLRGYQDNAIIYWDLYPQHLKDLFTQAFTIGLKSPARRVTENKWLETFANASLVYTFRFHSNLLCGKDSQLKDKLRLNLESIHQLNKPVLSFFHTFLV